MKAITVWLARDDDGYGPMVYMRKPSQKDEYGEYAPPLMKSKGIMKPGQCHQFKLVRVKEKK